MIKKIILAVLLIAVTPLSTHSSSLESSSSLTQIELPSDNDRIRDLFNDLNMNLPDSEIALLLLQKKTEVMELLKKHFTELLEKQTQIRELTECLRDEYSLIADKLKEVLSVNTNAQKKCDSEVEQLIQAHKYDPKKKRKGTIQKLREMKEKNKEEKQKIIDEPAERMLHRNKLSNNTTLAQKKAYTEVLCKELNAIRNNSKAELKKLIEECGLTAHLSESSSSLD